MWIGGQREGHLAGIIAATTPWGTYELRIRGESWAEIKQPLMGRNWVRNDYWFFGSDDGWMVGFLPDQEFKAWQGKIARWDGKKWIGEKLDKVSKHWELKAVDFESVKSGWAVGSDIKRDTGVLLEFAKKKWKPVGKKELPEISGDWMLWDVKHDGGHSWWAVGKDFDGERGVILRLE